MHNSYSQIRPVETAQSSSYKFYIKLFPKIKIFKSLCAVILNTLLEHSHQHPMSVVGNIVSIVIIEKRDNVTMALFL